MNIYLCGFNGFRQIEGLETLLNCFPGFSAQCVIDKNELLGCKFVDGNLENSRNEMLCTEDHLKEMANQTSLSVARDGHTEWTTAEVSGIDADHINYQCACSRTKIGEKDEKHFICQCMCSRKRKYANMLQAGPVSSNEVGAKMSKSCGRNYWLLKDVACFSEEKIRIHHVEMTWARIAVTVSEISDSTKPEAFHTLISGYNSDLSSREPLQLHLTDIRLRASTSADILLQHDLQHDQYLLLSERSSQAVVAPLSMSLATDHADGSSCSLRDDIVGFCSGTSSSFIACYGGISICNLTAECNNSSADSDENVEIVRLIFTPLDSGVSVQQVSCGLEHTLLLTQHGGVMSFGSGSRGQLGHGDLEEEQQPRIVEALEGLHYVDIAAGGWHSAAVSEFGDLYMWGWNESGQLGLPCPSVQEQHKCNRQQHLPDLKQLEHCCSLEENEASAQRKAIGVASLYLSPAVVDVGMQSQSVHLQAVACGTRHTAVLSKCGQVYTTGWNKYGQLGLTHSDNIDCFSKVLFPCKNAFVQQVYCGSWNSLFLVKSE